MKGYRTAQEAAELWGVTARLYKEYRIPEAQRVRWNCLIPVGAISQLAWIRKEDRLKRQREDDNDMIQLIGEKEIYIHPHFGKCMSISLEVVWFRTA